MVLVSKGMTDKSCIVPFILYANFSEKYTPPRVVGDLTGVGELEYGKT